MCFPAWVFALIIFRLLFQKLFFFRLFFRYFSWLCTASYLFVHHSVDGCCVCIHVLFYSGVSNENVIDEKIKQWHKMTKRITTHSIKFERWKKNVDEKCELRNKNWNQKQKPKKLFKKAQNGFEQTHTNTQTIKISNKIWAKENYTQKWK